MGRSTLGNIEGKSLTILQYTKSTLIGWMLGLILILLSSAILDAFDIHTLQLHLGISMAAGVSFMQLRVLKKELPINSNWIWFTILGMTLPFIISDLFSTNTFRNKLFLNILSGAFITGVLQFLLLKKYSSRAYLWLLGCLAGWAFAVITVLAIDFTMYLRPLISNKFFIALINLFLIIDGGIVLGLITGYTLKKLHIINKAVI